MPYPLFSFIMIHAIITAVGCFLVWLLGIPSSFAIAFPGFYFGREFAQAEYRYIEQYCNHKRANMPWYAPFTIKAWTLKSVLDCLLPLGVYVCFYLVVLLAR